MFRPWDLISQCASGTGGGTFEKRPDATVVLSTIGAKMSEASSVSPGRSQVTESLRGPFSTLCFSPPGCAPDPSFLQGCLPRAQNKDTHLPPLPPSLSVEDASSSAGKRQTCDIEGVGVMGAAGLKG